MIKEYRKDMFLESVAEIAQKYFMFGEDEYSIVDGLQELGDLMSRSDMFEMNSDERTIKYIGKEEE